MDMADLDSDDNFEDIRGEQEEDAHYSLAVQRMDPNVLLVLRNFQAANEVVERFAEADVQFNQLAGLDNEDLELFGVTDEQVQDDMMSAFRMLQNQLPHLEEALGILRERGQGVPKQKSVVDLIQDQLTGLNTILAATIMKVGAAQSSQSPGVVLNSNFNPPKVVLGMLERMTVRTAEMTDLIRQLKDQRGLEEKKVEMDKQSKKKLIVSSLLLASGIIIGFVLAKQWLSRAFF